MKPIPQSLAANLTKVMTAFVSESRCEGRTDADYCISRLLKGYADRSMDAYADDPVEPKHVIVFSKNQGIVTNEKIVAVQWVYSIPEERGSEESMAAFANMIENYSTMFGADATIASDWVFRGCKTGAAALWKSLGFERQEIVYVKLKK
jgi:hypothetical protein